MSEENNQENNNLENNQETTSETTEQTVIDGKVRVNKNPQEWKKWLVITIAAFLGGFLAIYVMTDRINHAKESRERKSLEAAGLRGQYKHNKFHNRDRNRHHKMRIDDYEMSYEGDFFDSDFAEREIEQAKRDYKEMEKKFDNYFQVKDLPQTNSTVMRSNMEGNIYKVSIKAPNFKDNEIRYEFKGNKLKIKGETEIKDKNYKKELEFSQEITLPAKPSVNMVKTFREGEYWILTVPLQIDE